MSNLQITKCALQKPIIILSGNTADNELCSYTFYRLVPRAHSADLTQMQPMGLLPKYNGSGLLYKSGVSFQNVLPESLGKVEDLGLELGLRMSDIPRVWAVTSTHQSLQQSAVKYKNTRPLTFLFKYRKSQTHIQLSNEISKFIPLSKLQKQ